MFRAIMTSCSLAVRTMRACAQGGLGGPCPLGGGSGGAFAPPVQQGGLGGGTPPNVWTVSDLLLKSVKKWKMHFRSTLPLSFKVDRAAPIYFEGRCGNAVGSAIE